ncbi:RibD family protein [uncultured Hydrogenophaga sp.]|uniref:RibD family protein n=1 Tax=uncultured Hydrogenophaga sp. TaxID=199683 RepID=UPI0025900A2F|nr:RibD family protein [uncultured Hydrogenophaga sp.]
MKPQVIAYCEVSADGKSTHRRHASSKPMMKFEDEAIRRYRHGLRARCDAILVGANTAKLDNPLLTVRDAMGPDPLRVVPSSRGDLPLDLNLLTDGGRTLIAVSEAAPDSHRSALRATGAEVLVAGTDRVDLPALLTQLGQRGVLSLMVEGGATILASLFRAGMVDRLIVQHLPVVFGGDDTPAMVGGPPLQNVDDAIPLSLVEVQRVGHHAVIVYERR